ncbi:MAG: hypothetical protein VX367_08240, partial [SAR324 cluster bacterium]|nr:hypothetical protein [SAR324 cluster bacterium]
LSLSLSLSQVIYVFRAMTDCQLSRDLLAEVAENLNHSFLFSISDIHFRPRKIKRCTCAL